MHEFLLYNIEYFHIHVKVRICLLKFCQVRLDSIRYRYVRMRIWGKIVKDRYNLEEMHTKLTKRLRFLSDDTKNSLCEKNLKKFLQL